AEGNRIRRRSIRHDPEETADHVRRCKALFTPAFFAERKGYGADAGDPVFIVGLPRVGSTLVEQILASHSAVEGTKELVNLSGIALSLGPANTGLAEERYPEVLGGLRQEAFHELGRRYVAQTRSQRKLDRPFFIDKMPNNFAHVAFIHLILPHARIIDVRRHPMACGWSLFKHLFARGQNFSYSLEDIAAHYRSYVDLMAHFDAVLPGRVLRVCYESLVNETEAEVRRLLEYCGLPFEESCLRYFDNSRAVSTPSSEQVRTPIFRDALEHWRNFEPWLLQLRETLRSPDR
ncbi:MAG: sulfotransferase family protein, partial [Gammaproteobacteria bacterium]